MEAKTRVGLIYLAVILFATILPLLPPNRNFVHFEANNIIDGSTLEKERKLISQKEILSEVHKSALLVGFSFIIELSPDNFSHDYQLNRYRLSFINFLLFSILSSTAYLFLNFLKEDMKVSNEILISKVGIILCIVGIIGYNWDKYFFSRIFSQVVTKIPSISSINSKEYLSSDIFCFIFGFLFLIFGQHYELKRKQLDSTPKKT